MRASLRIVVNGEDRELADNLLLEQLVADLHLALDRVAIERNGNVVRRSEWQTTVLAENDRVEIVHFVGGG